MSSDGYRRVASAVRYTCEELARELQDAVPEVGSWIARPPTIRLLRGDATTCYGIVSVFRGNPPISLVTGRLVQDAGRERVELVRVPIVGPALVPALARAERALQRDPYACACGHDLPFYPREFPARGEYVCPACRFVPFRPKTWRGSPAEDPRTP